MTYSYVNRRRESLQEPEEVFHTRQLSYPILVTVYHMLECHFMDVIPYSPGTVMELLNDDPRDPDIIRTRKTMLNVEDVSDWCIFSVEIRNAYGLPFEVSFGRFQPGTSDFDYEKSLSVLNYPFAEAEPMTATAVVPPGSTSRYATVSCLPIMLTFLAKNYGPNQEIPSIRRSHFPSNPNAF